MPLIQMPVRPDIAARMLPVGAIPKVLVYGTLKEGYHNHHFLNTSKKIGEYWLHGFSMHHLGSYPAIYLDPNQNSKILGEIYELADDHVLKAIDKLESIPWHYQREVVNCGQFGPCYTYVQQKPIFEYKWIDSGIWRGIDTKYQLRGLVKYAPQNHPDFPMGPNGPRNVVDPRGAPVSVLPPPTRDLPPIGTTGDVKPHIKGPPALVTRPPYTPPPPPLKPAVKRVNALLEGFGDFPVEMSFESEQKRIAASEAKVEDKK